MSPSDLDKKLAKMAELSGELGDSWKILSMFPDAFAYGPVRFAGVVKQMPQAFGRPRETQGFIRAWFELGDGTTHRLSREQLLTFRPDEVIHPDYK